MKRTNAKSVGEIITEVLRKERLDLKLEEQRALALWPRLVGAGIDQYTTARSVKNGVLTFTISSAPLRNQLMLSRTTLIQRINSIIGREVIKEIVFR